MIFTRNETNLNDYKNITIVADPQRLHFSSSLSLFIDRIISKTKVTKSNDIFFGTTIKGFATEFFEIYEQEAINHWTTGRNASKSWDIRNLDDRDYLITFNIRQSDIEQSRTIISKSIYEFVSLLGAFWGVLINLGTWSLRPYIRFQFNKNKIKDLYFYSRTKRPS